MFFQYGDVQVASVLHVEFDTAEDRKPWIRCNPGLAGEHLEVAGLNSLIHDHIFVSGTSMPKFLW